MKSVKSSNTSPLMATMTIKVGDKVRDRFTKEEGMVVGISNNMPNCVVVRFANSRAYLIDREKLEPATVESPSEMHRRFT